MEMFDPAPARILSLPPLLVRPMPERCEAVCHDNGTKTCFFEPSPKMSSYLLCFVVSEMDCLQGKSARGVLCRVFTPLGKKAMGAFALEHCVLALDRYRGHPKINEIIYTYIYITLK